MAVAIKANGFTNIKIYNGGLKDWIKSGNTTESIDPLPETKVTFIAADQLMTSITEADEKDCIDKNGQPLLTLIDFRISRNLFVKKGADKYQIKTKCLTVTVLLDDFIDNNNLIRSIPEKGLTVSISETGNRDTFLIRYLSKSGKTDVQALKYGMRSWLKADYPVETVAPTGKD
jgi:3-mercaptopyruvate sulfurtransferase SseA